MPRLALPAALALALAACSQVAVPTPIVVTPGPAPVATVPVAPTVGPFAPILAQYEQDVAGLLNASNGPPVDTLGVNFANALIALNKAVVPSGASSSTAICTPCILTKIEQLRQQAGNSSANSVIKLAETAVQTGNLWVADTKLKGLAVGANVAGILVQIEQALVS